MCCSAGSVGIGSHVISSTDPVSAPPHQSYAELAAVYDALYAAQDSDLEMWRGVTRGARHLLEVGCGTGRVLAAVACHGLQMQGLDISAEMLSVAARRLPDTPLWHCDLRDVPLADSIFDCVIAPRGCLTHLLIPDERIAGLREMHRLLRADGVLVLDVPQVAEDDPMWQGAPFRAHLLARTPLRDIHFLLYTWGDPKTRLGRHLTTWTIVRSDPSNADARETAHGESRLVTAYLTASELGAEAEAAGFDILGWKSDDRFDSPWHSPDQPPPPGPRLVVRLTPKKAS